MKAAVPILAPLLRSNTQGEILALLFLNEEDEFSLAEITRRVGGFPATVHREIERLTGSGVLLDRTSGRSRLVRVNPDHPMYRPLGEILLLGYGPKTVLEPLISELPGVDEAFIFGSWAARYEGQNGPVPQDIDLLIVGSTPRDVLNDAAREAQTILRREVNATRVSSEDWAEATKPFIATVKARPIVSLSERKSSR